MSTGLTGYLIGGKRLPISPTGGIGLSRDSRIPIESKRRNEVPVGHGGKKRRKSTTRYHKSARRKRRTTGEIAAVRLLHLSPAGVECTAEIVDGSCSACGWSQPAKRAPDPVTPPPPGSMTSVAARQFPDREREFADKRKAKADREAKQRDDEAEAERLETLAQREANNEAIRSGRKKRRRKRDPFIDEFRPY